MLLIKLLFAHLLGDFFLQKSSWVAHKKKYKLKSSRLYLHVLIHVVLMFLFFWDFSLWPIVLIVGVSHLMIDALKIILQNEKNKRWLFITDQILHFAVIIGVYFIFTDTDFRIDQVLSQKHLIYILGLLFLTRPTSFIMQNIFTKWDITALTENNESLEDAGKYIGILERILVFIFIMSGHWEAVGFLITAKSVFRFGDLKESKHRKLTEYILIGTLMSFGIAIGTALIAGYFI
ncbi:Protein of unknown function [Flavobacteriaceae bacterium MAR_2010_188]|nr:Protein of unknown function [Flavobacteriaceae bacterium MAR_2010_188]